MAVRKVTKSNTAVWEDVHVIYGKNPPILETSVREEEIAERIRTDGRIIVETESMVSIEGPVSYVIIRYGSNDLYVHTNKRRALLEANESFMKSLREMKTFR